MLQPIFQKNAFHRLSTLSAHWFSAHTYNCITYLREGTLLQSDIPNHSYPTPLIFALSGLTSS
nr:MAG TPA: protein of unknown function DUF3328 [Caudoviricetes sp.]